MGPRDFGFFLEDGSVSRSAGDLEFGWVLGGRALQDIWINYPNDGTKKRSVGTSIRFFDEKSRTWRVVFVSPAYGGLLTVQGGLDGDRIVLRGTDDVTARGGAPHEAQGHDAIRLVNRRRKR